MKLKTVYLVLCLFGVLLPYSQFVPWVASNGLHLRLMWQQLFSNQVSGFFAMDVLLSSLVLLLFMHSEGARLGIRNRWLPLLALLTMGVSLALPLFLYLRELRIEESSAGTRMANA
jgi:hypothetical protein